MKKILSLFLLAATSLLGLTVNDLKMSQATSASPPAYADRIFPPVASGLLGTDGSLRPQGIIIGANLTLTGNTLSATSTGGSVNWGSIGGLLSNQADLVAALAGKQDSLTFSTGLTNTSGTITVNAAQILTKITNLTTNGFIKTSAADGTLIIDTSTYLTANQTITLSGDASGSGGTSIAVTVTKLNGTSLAALATGILKNTTSTGVPSIATAGTDYVAPGSITSSGLTMATARLLGRSTASAGDVEEITVGSGLALSGGTLTASGGSGSVTTVSVVTANGISGSVANATTTPAITLTLGAITPSTVNALTLASQSVGFTIAGGTSSRTLTLSGNATVSGTNTGDQTNITGNAGTATALQTARAINGVDFDGTIPITIGVAASDITGTTLANNVVTSSLTTVGVIGTGVWQGSLVTGTYGGTGVNNSTRTITVAGNLVTVGAFTTTITATNTTAVTLPTTGTLATLGNDETFTGVKTFAPTLRATGSASYLTVTVPADAAITTATESIGVNFSAGTRTWATGAVTLQREHVFAANTIAAAGASTFTTAVNVDIADPIAGTNATLTNAYSLRAASVLFTGIIKAGSGPTTLTNSTGQILSAALASPSGVIDLIGSTRGSILYRGASGWAILTPGTSTWVLTSAGAGADPAWAAAGGGGSGTVNSGTATNFAYYAGTGTTVDGTSTMTVSSTGRLTMTPTVVTSGVVPFLTITTPADTTLTAGTEAIGIKISGATRQHASNTAIGFQRDVLFNQNTHGFASAGGTIIVAATVAIEGAPAVGTNNAGYTNAGALWIQSGAFMMGANNGSLAKLTESSGLLTISSVTGMNLRPASAGIAGQLLITGISQDIVLSDDTSFPLFQPGGTTRGIYFQRAGNNTAAIYGLSVGTTSGVEYSGYCAGGVYGGLTATASTMGGWSARMFTYGGTTYVAVAKIQMLPTQNQSETARGSQIIFQTTPNSTTTTATVLTIDQDGSVKAFRPLGGLGYGTGAGGAVTQATSKSTGVTLNKVTGQITMNNAALAALTSVTFTLTDSAIAATDTVQVAIASGGTVGDYLITVNATAAGSCQITVYNCTAATPLSEALVLNFTVLKGVSS